MPPLPGFHHGPKRIRMERPPGSLVRFLATNSQPSASSWVLVGNEYRGHKNGCRSAPTTALGLVSRVTRSTRRCVTVQEMKKTLRSGQSGVDLKPSLRGSGVKFPRAYSAIASGSVEADPPRLSAARTTAEVASILCARRGRDDQGRMRALVRERRSALEHQNLLLHHGCSA